MTMAVSIKSLCFGAVCYSGQSCSTRHEAVYLQLEISEPIASQPIGRLVTARLSQQERYCKFKVLRAHVQRTDHILSHIAHLNYMTWSASLSRAGLQVEKMKRLRVVIEP